MEKEKLFFCLLTPFSYLFYLFIIYSFFCFFTFIYYYHYFFLPLTSSSDTHTHLLPPSPLAQQFNLFKISTYLKSIPSGNVFIPPPLLRRPPHSRIYTSFVLFLERERENPYHYRINEKKRACVSGRLWERYRYI